MNKINIWLNQPSRDCLHAVYGSELQIELVIRDLQLSAGAYASAFTTPRGGAKVYEMPCVINGNSIIVKTVAGAFQPGSNILQIKLVNDALNIISFELPVECEENITIGQMGGVKDLNEYIVPLSETAKKIEEFTKDFGYSGVLGLKFESGGLSDKQGTPQTNTARARSGFTIIKAGWTYTAPEGYGLAPFRWINGVYTDCMVADYVHEFTPDTGATVKFTLKKNSGDTINDAEIPSLDIAYRYITSPRERIDAIEGEVKGIYGMIGVPVKLNFMQGTLNADGTSKSDANRIYSEYHKMEQGKYLAVTLNGQNAAVCWYDEDKNFLLNTGWINTDFIIPYETGYVRIAVRKGDAEVDNSSAKAPIVPSELSVTFESVDADSLTERLANCENAFKTVLHRGLNKFFPENTAPAFKMGRKLGFVNVETDIQLSRDGIPVVLHNPTINSTSDHTGNVWDYTLEELKSFDFGSWKSPAFAGEKILTYEEMLLLCKSLGQKVYVEIKGRTSDTQWTEDDIKKVLTITRHCGMWEHVRFISFDLTQLTRAKTFDPTVSLGVLDTNFTESEVRNAAALRTGYNDVICITEREHISDDICRLMQSYDLPLSAYFYDCYTHANAIHPYVSETLSNSWDLGKYFAKTGAWDTARAASDLPIIYVDHKFPSGGGGGEGGYDDTAIKARISALELKAPSWDAKSNFSGDYDDLTNKPEAVTDEHINALITAKIGNDDITDTITFSAGYWKNDSSVQTGYSNNYLYSTRIPVGNGVNIEYSEASHVAMVVMWKSNGDDTYTNVGSVSYSNDIKLSVVAGTADIIGINLRNQVSSAMSAEDQAAAKSGLKVYSVKNLTAEDVNAMIDAKLEGIAELADEIAEVIG